MSKGFLVWLQSLPAVNKRFEDANYSKVGKTAASILTSMAILGDYVSHDVVKKSVCGQKIARVVTVVFANEGQYEVDCWVFKVKDDWALTTLHSKGEGNTLTFIGKLTEMIKSTCE